MFSRISKTEKLRQKPSACVWAGEKVGGFHPVWQLELPVYWAWPACLWMKVKVSWGHDASFDSRKQTVHWLTDSCLNIKQACDILYFALLNKLCNFIFVVVVVGCEKQHSDKTPNLWLTVSMRQDKPCCTWQREARNLPTDLPEFLVVFHLCFITPSVYLINPLDWLVGVTCPPTSPPLSRSSISALSLPVSIIIWAYLPAVAGGFCFVCSRRSLSAPKQWLMMPNFWVDRNMAKHAPVLKNIICMNKHSVAHTHDLPLLFPVGYLFCLLY